MPPMRCGSVSKSSCPGAGGRVVDRGASAAVGEQQTTQYHQSPTEGAMKRVLLVVTAVLCVAAVGAAAETPKPRPGAGGPRSDLANDEAIRKLYTDFTAAWNAH